VGIAVVWRLSPRASVSILGKDRWVEQAAVLFPEAMAIDNMRTDKQLGSYRKRPYERKLIKAQLWDIPRNHFPFPTRRLSVLGVLFGSGNLTLSEIRRRPLPQTQENFQLMHPILNPIFYSDFNLGKWIGYMIPFNLDFFCYGGIPIPLIISEGFGQRFIRNQACFRLSCQHAGAVNDIGRDGFVLMPVDDVDINRIVFLGIHGGNIKARNALIFFGVESFTFHISIDGIYYPKTIAMSRWKKPGL
jgi:hypothetical protein